ncbi:response regulator [Formosa algae]|uniref:response regulator n=1 Tax=Formosa algae TaxID=225843 RepID=UPI00209C3286|nr:response regulator [Formosa algae]
MFKKVLIVDDYDVVNEGVLTVLNTKGVINVEKAQYCDDAFLKLKKADLDKEPFDLLITDLSFKEDFHEGEILSGDELVIAVRGYGLKLPIIVYSMEDRLQRVRTLINKYNVNAYVCKGRRSSLELGQAILDIQDKKYFYHHKYKMH